MEPYQGAATGVGGIIRDIFTMGARPIALLNSLRFGPLDPLEDATGRTDAAAATRNRYLLGGVVAGIAGYGNCIGIPDVGGEIGFDATYNGNPLVNAMCVGIARHDEITLARAAGPGNALLLVGASTGRDGIQGASFASASLGEDRDERRPAVQVGNPFLEKLLMEACLELSGSDAVVAMQDLGAAGLTCALAEVSARGGCGAEVDLDLVPRREPRMTPYEVLLSESQERMLLVVRAGREAEVRAVFDRYELHAVTIGRVIAEPVVRALRRGVSVVCEVPGPRADRRRAALHARRPRRPPTSPRDAPSGSTTWPRQAPSTSTLLELLASPNARSRRPIWRRYDHMNGTNTLVGPGAGDAALLRIKGTAAAIALSLDGPGRIGALDPYLAGAAAVVEGAINVACSGATPIGITNCLNFGSPEEPAGYWQLAEAVAGHGGGLPRARRPDRLGQRQPLQRDAGWADPADPGGRHGRAAAGSIARRRRCAGAPATRSGCSARRPGTPPPWPPRSSPGGAAGSAGSRRSTLPRPPRLVTLLGRLAADGLLAGAHDASVGGLGVALARLAIASSAGAALTLPPEASRLPAGEPLRGARRPGAGGGPARGRGRAGGRRGCGRRGSLPAGRGRRRSAGDRRSARCAWRQPRPAASRLELPLLSGG